MTPTPTPRPFFLGGYRSRRVKALGFSLSRDRCPFCSVFSEIHRAVPIPSLALGSTAPCSFSSWVLAAASYSLGLQPRTFPGMLSPSRLKPLLLASSGFQCSGLTSLKKHVFLVWHPARLGRLSPLPVPRPALTSLLGPCVVSRLLLCLIPSSAASPLVANYVCLPECPAGPQHTAWPGGSRVLAE